MADVRAMLRNERAARRIAHPQAQYTSTGALICKACHIQLKSDAIWQSHISSHQHINALKSLASGLMAQGANKGTKRKADDEEDLDDDGSRKRTKPTEPEPESEPADAAVPNEPEEPEMPSLSTHSVAEVLRPTIDEDEWAAFEREVVEEPPPNATAQGNVMAGATISAAPVTAAELAARSRDEQSTQAKEKREADIEGEKEDAQRRLEEEFDEMEELEARVKRLKDQREALRRKTQTSTASVPQIPLPKPADTGEADEDDSEDDDWDDWGAL